MKQPSFYLRWDDDKKIEEIIREMNFGKYAGEGKP